MLLIPAAKNSILTITFQIAKRTSLFAVKDFKRVFLGGIEDGWIFKKIC